MAQSTSIKGQVTDAVTGEALISATVSFQDTSIGTNTDFDGNYELQTNTPSDTIVISYLGYQSFKKAIKKGTSQTIDIKLEENAINLETLVVTAGKERYRNKDNPAVQLIKKVIAQKDNNRASNYDFYEYEKYEKILLGLSNINEKFKKRRAFKKIQFLFEDLDTSAMAGKEMLPIYLREKLGEVRFRKSPEKTKELILADTMVTFEGYADNDGFNQYLDNLYQKIDIYDNNIVILNQQFLSPIANGAPSFYKFYIQDTLQVDGVECIELFFAPRNNLDILFQGSIYIAHKDNYNVKKVDMSVNPNISLNWVKTLNLTQLFEKKEGYGYIQTKDQFTADFGLSKKGMGIYGSRSVSTRNIRINEVQPDEYYAGPSEEIKIASNTDKFWSENRHDALSDSEANTYEKIDSLKNVKIFRKTMDIAMVLLSGYTKITPYFELGPVNTFYSFNPIEGFRLRAGGRTTQAFSKKVEIETYGAYGFKDKKWKGYLGLSYALPNGNMHKNPVKKLLAVAQRETQIPGQALQFVQEDNLLLSFKRGVNDKYLYNTIYRLEYLNEYESDWTFSIGLKNWTQTPVGNWAFNTKTDEGESIQVKDLRTSEFNAMLRWAPNEQFYQGKTYRIPIYNSYPVFTMRYNIGVKNVLGGQYNYHNLSLRIFKRMFMSRLGYSDMYLDGGIIFGQLPYPLMSVHAANQTYSFQLQGYNLMNFLEFVSDRYVSLNIDHNFNGFFLNRIPLIKHLKLREVCNIRVLYGGISDRNKPSLHDNLIAFPTDEEGNTTTYTLADQPYVEASLGLANILKIFRVDVVRRFTYLNNPAVTKWGIRMRFKIYF